MESLDDAREELKRVDHLIYVSLKYTRTVDVFLNAVGRMIDAYEFMFDAVLKHAVEHKKIKDVPKTPIEKGNLVLELYPDDLQFKQNVDMFFLLRKLAKSTAHTKEQEYRRHVTMRAQIDGREEILDIDNMTERYHMQMDFYGRVRKVIMGDDQI
jgi:hypothetical protein